MADSKKNKDKLQYFITTVIYPGFFESDVNLDIFEPLLGIIFSLQIS